MKVATLENQNVVHSDADIQVSVAVHELEEGKIARERATQFIGACAVGAEVELDTTHERFSRYESLYDAMLRAREGDEVARALVRMNVRTDMVERTIKSGHVTEVELDVDEAANILQFGQKMESVQANSLRYAARIPQMRRRVEAETTNSFSIKEVYKTGKLEDSSVVVFSCAADDMPEAAMKDVGFFTDTMSCSIQVTSAQGNKLTTESAFVAGVKHPGAERHDIETVVAIAKQFNVDLAGKGATEILGAPILIPNELIKNGALDIVKMWDEYRGDTFFGEAKPQQDYKAYRKQCQEREETLQQKVDLATEELIQSAHLVHSRVEAIELLGELSGKHMIQQAVFDTEINPVVFGEVSAEYIYAARERFEQGDLKQGLNLVEKAIQNDASSSCAGAASGNDLEKKSTSENESCTFVSKKCPKCGTKNVLTKVTATRISGSCGCSTSKKSK